MFLSSEIYTCFLRNPCVSCITRSYAWHHLIIYSYQCYPSFLFCSAHGNIVINTWLTIIPYGSECIHVTCKASDPSALTWTPPSPLIFLTGHRQRKPLEMRMEQLSLHEALQLRSPAPKGDQWRRGLRIFKGCQLHWRIMQRMDPGTASEDNANVVLLRLPSLHGILFYDPRLSVQASTRPRQQASSATVQLSMLANHPNCAADGVSQVIRPSPWNSSLWPGSVCPWSSLLALCVCQPGSTIFWRGFLYRLCCSDDVMLPHWIQPWWDSNKEEQYRTAWEIHPSCLLNLTEELCNRRSSTGLLHILVL